MLFRQAEASPQSLYDRLRMLWCCCGNWVDLDSSTALLTPAAFGLGGNSWGLKLFFSFLFFLLLCHTEEWRRVPGPHCLPVRCMCNVELLNFQFGIHINGLEQPQSQSFAVEPIFSEKKMQGNDLQIVMLTTYQQHYITDIFSWYICRIWKKKIIILATYFKQTKWRLRLWEFSWILNRPVLVPCCYNLPF